MKRLSIAFVLVAAAVFLGSGCSTFREKPRTASQDDIRAINDAMAEYPQTRKLRDELNKKPATPKATKLPAPAAPQVAKKRTTDRTVTTPGKVTRTAVRLALHYSFDRAAYRDGTVADESGHGHDGTVFGAILSDDKERGSVYYFNGVNNYILAGKMGYFSTGTISFWMKAEKLENWRNPFSTDYANWDSCIRFEESSDGQFCIGALGLGAGPFTTSMKPMTWYHVAYAWDDMAAYGYLDGKAVFTINHPDPKSSVHPNISNNAGYWKGRSLDFRNVAVGNGYSTDPSRYWKGWIDDVRIYYGPLTESEVSKLYMTTKIIRR